jgi:hypothetical protein
MNRKLASILFWSLAGLIALVTLCPVEWRPQTGHSLLERGALYGVLGASCALAFGRRPVFEAGLVSLIAAGLEAAQALVPGRHGRWIDAMEKTAVAGLLLVLGVLALADRWGAATDRQG